jgi:hypothetical protein
MLVTALTALGSFRLNQSERDEPGCGTQFPRVSRFTGAGLGVTTLVGHAE